MKTEYKHIKFVFNDAPHHRRKKTDVWTCYNHDGELLGEVRWHPAWRQYCWFQEDDIVMAASCLNDVSDFIQQMMVVHKDMKKLTKGKPVHKRHGYNVLGDDMVACKLLSLPQYHKWNVCSDWNKVTCKKCLATKGRPRFGKNGVFGK